MIQGEGECTLSEMNIDKYHSEHQELIDKDENDKKASDQNESDQEDNEPLNPSVLAKCVNQCEIHALPYLASLSELTYQIWDDDFIWKYHAKMLGFEPNCTQLKDGWRRFLANAARKRKNVEATADVIHSSFLHVSEDEKLIESVVMDDGSVLCLLRSEVSKRTVITKYIAKESTHHHHRHDTSRRQYEGINFRIGYVPSILEREYLQMGPRHNRILKKVEPAYTIETTLSNIRFISDMHLNLCKALELENDYSFIVFGEHIVFKR